MLYFVQGLRFSAELIYEIRRLLPSTRLAAHWGHLVKGDDILCSLECDIILHVDGKRRRWNGEHPDPVFDFWFIEPPAVRVVVSCKSMIESPSEVDAVFCKNLHDYGVHHVWLFAECCTPGSLGAIERRARKVGYDHFFHLYTLDPGTRAHSLSNESCRKFVKAVRALESRRRRT